RAGGIHALAEVDWPRTGRIVCGVEGIRTDLFQDFLKAHVQEGQIRNLNVFARWTNGPMTFGVELAGVVVPPKELMGSIQGKPPKGRTPNVRPPEGGTPNVGSPKGGTPNVGPPEGGTPNSEAGFLSSAVEI